MSLQIPCHRYVTKVLIVEKEVEKKIEAQFITRQLFSIFSVLDLSTDDVGRSVGSLLL